MEKGRAMIYFIFAVMPILCIGINTRSLSSPQNNFRTENGSNLGLNDQLDFRDKYFDVLFRFVQANRNSYMFGSNMQRTLRSFDPNFPLRASIKREKEVFENLGNLQYLGSEIPKKYTEKRFSPQNRNSMSDMQHILGTRLNNFDSYNRNSVERLVRNGIASGLEEQLKFDYSDGDKYQPPWHIPELKNIPETGENLHLPGSISKLSNTTTLSLAWKNGLISKRSLPLSRRSRFDQDVCNMDDLEIDISFREMMDTAAGSLLLTCSGSIVVKKCEGACNSRVQPSVNNYDGFEKQCSCCKDSGVRTRTVTLSICTLGPEEVHGYSISGTILEPTACSCQECRN